MRNHYVRSSLAAQTGEILDVDDVFDTVLYTGDGGTDRAIQVGSGVDFAAKGGLVWIKNRTSASNHVLQDTNRGAGEEKKLASNLYSGETGSSSTGYIKSFTSTGFKVDRGGTSSAEETNRSSRNYVAWCMRKAQGFFDVQTYTGNGTSGRQISHNLDSVPGAIWIKALTNSYNRSWICYHRQTASSSPEDYYLVLDTTAAKTNSTNFADTAPTSTYFFVGNGTNVNQSGQEYVAYIFGHNDARFGSSQNKSIIQCGGYYGNGSTNGTTVNIGWRPQFLIFKNPSHASMNWRMYDTERGIPSGLDPRLMPNTTDAEQTTFDKLDLTSTGFKTQHTGSDMNQNNTLITYIAIREPW